VTGPGADQGNDEIGPLKQRCTEAPSTGFLPVTDVGLPVKALCRKHGVSDAGYCRWKARLGGISLSDARRQSRAGRRRSRDPGRSRSGERCRSIRRPSRIVIPFDPQQTRGCSRGPWRTPVRYRLQARFRRPFLARRPPRAASVARPCFIADRRLTVQSQAPAPLSQLRRRRNVTATR